MPYDISDAQRPGTEVMLSNVIFQEVGPRGGKTKRFVGVPMGRELPKTKRAGNLWKPRTAADFKKGLS